MEQQTLINEAAQLINQASERQGAGAPEEARTHLENLRDLLDDELDNETDGQKEQKQEGSKDD